jgi:3-oxoacyl-[acyl-carrier-protein] synthase II
MHNRRVVVTGLGAIAPLGNDVKSNWNSVINGKSGIKSLTKFDISLCASKVAAEVKNYNAENYFDPIDIRKMDDFIQFGMIASSEAVKDSGWQPKNDEERERTGVMIGSGIGGLNAIERAATTIHDGAKRTSPYFLVSCLINLISGQVSIKHDFRGPNHAVSTACATGSHAIGDAMRLIKYGDADVMVVGGAEASINPTGMIGFVSSKALSTHFSDNPEAASRPWDKARDGFVMGEGAGVIVIEEYEHAKKRGAKIYAEIVGYGLAGDAYHVTSPHPEGRGAMSAMKNALKDAGITQKDIDYINAHGTSTPMGDGIELDAVQKLFLSENPNILMSSTKSMTGHLLGAAGSLEAIFAILALKHNIAPPTINMDDPMDEVRIDLVANTAKEHNMNYVMNNSFGFGGTNVSLVFKKI